MDRLLEMLTKNGVPTGGAGPGTGRHQAPSGRHQPPSGRLQASGTDSGTGAIDDDVIPHFLRLVSILEPNELYQAIVNSVIALTHTDRGFLTLVEEGNKLRFKHLHNLEQSQLGSPALAPAREMIKRVLQTGQGIVQPLPGKGAVLCAPLKFGKRLDGRERVGGALYADTSASGRQLGEGQLKMLGSLAEHSAIALENAHIYYKSEQSRGQILRLKDNITKLYDVGRSISSTLILEDLLSIVCEHVVQISRAQRGFVMLLEGDLKDPEAEKKLVFRVGRDARGRVLKEEQFKFSTTLCKKAIDQRKSQLMLQPIGNDLSVSMVEMELASIMVVPLIEKETVIGLVYVDSKQSNYEFDQADSEIVESLCGQAAVAIVNAKLYKEAGEKERLAHELELAAKLQADLLPKEIPPVNGLEMYGLLYPALEVGGDYYDFVVHEGTTDHLTIVIGDVSGKGTGAGIVMAMARSALRSLVNFERNPTSPLPIMKSLNVEMCRDIPAGMFMTLNVLIWHANERKFLYAPAGHEHLLIYRAATRQVEKIKAGGVACGVLKQASAMYKEQSLQMGPGDHLLLYTDGVTEAMNEDHKEMGLDATIQIVQQYGHLDPKSLCEAIYNAIVEFRGAADPHDDITLVGLKVTG